MVISLASRFSKIIAWVFAFLMYGQMLFSMPLNYSRSVRHNDRYEFNFSNTNAGEKRSAEKKSDLVNVKKEIPTKSPTHLSAPASPARKFTTGPTQPEMQSFQSVNANNMVDLFSGDFSYNSLS
jgi:hypothetical protein